MLKICESGHEMICFEVSYGSEKCPLCEQMKQTEEQEGIVQEKEERIKELDDEVQKYVDIIENAKE